MSATVAPATALARFASDHFNPVPVFGNEHCRVMVVAFEPRQEIQLHAPGINLVLTVASGSGELYADGHVHPLHEGDVVIVPAGETRGIRALSERLITVNTVTPLPGPGDHAPVTAEWPAPGSGS